MKISLPSLRSTLRKPRKFGSKETTTLTLGLRKPRSAVCPTSTTVLMRLLNCRTRAILPCFTSWVFFPQVSSTPATIFWWRSMPKTSRLKPRLSAPCLSNTFFQHIRLQTRARRNRHLAQVRWCRQQSRDEGLEPAFSHCCWFAKGCCQPWGCSQWIHQHWWYC